MDNTIEAQLRRTRRARGMTQAALAAEAGLSRFAVTRAETRADDTRLSTLEAMARALGLDILLVPSALRGDIDALVRAGGRVLAQPEGVDAPASIVDL
ncbi:helix-turn-helix transcriptional regulator [Achromobacter sp. GG226]|uniref:helix-turn-helix transcriptional regulator n=1 Tax=Verticiella alkaliphila TaxID=2779529 RepID=UPI001C0CC77F|nr:helix-turn-helix transcriptional regulator [Verticiella sp. GG226]MBU4610624.1 helix-turn-helix transcriptional regulator [Verticiella sp. GG226]